MNRTNNNRTCKVGIFLPNKKFLGSNLTLFPMLCGLKQLHKHKDIHISTYSIQSASSVFIENGWCDEFHSLNASKNINRDFIHHIRKQKFDVWINLRPASLRNHIISTFSGATKTIGLVEKSFHKFFYDHANLYNIHQYRGDNYANLLHHLTDNTIDAYHCFKEHNDKKIDLLDKTKEKEKDKEIFFIPGAGGKEKQWPLEYYLGLEEKIKNDHQLKHYKIVYLLGDMERDLLTPLRTSKRSIYMTPSINALIQRLSQSSLIIVGDCGPGHIGHILGLNQISLWGDDKVSFKRRYSEWTKERKNHHACYAGEGKSIDDITIDAVIEKIKLFNL